MTEFKLNIGREDIIIQTPEELGVKREEAFSIAMVKLQDLIADGILPINKRIWSCIFCDTEYEEQAELMGHLRSEEHIKKLAPIKKLADKHMPKEPSSPEPKVSFKCTKCDQSFISHKATRYHIETAHNNKGSARKIITPLRHEAQKYGRFKYNLLLVNKNSMR